MDYQSNVRVESQALAGVSFTVRRMSFGRRLELARETKELLGKIEFLSAGEKESGEQAEAALVSGELDGKLLRWGLDEIEGLEIDGRPADTERLIESGPEELVNEVLAAIRREAGLNEEERKNSESHSTSARESKPGGIAMSADA